MDHIVVFVVAYGVQHSAVHHPCDLPWFYRVIALVSLLQGLERPGHPRSSDVYSFDPFLSREVDIILHACISCISGLGCDEAVFGPSGGAENTGALVRLHYYHVHHRVSAVFHTQSCLLCGVCAPLSHSSNALEQRDFLLDFLSIVRIDGNTSREAAIGEVTALHTLVENPHDCGTGFSWFDAFPNLSYFSERFGLVEV